MQARNKNPGAFLQWFHAEYKSSALKTAVGCFGIGLAFTSTYSSYPLGYKFGLIPADKIKASNDGSIFLQILFGVGAYVPTATLVSFPNYREFRNLAGYVICEPQLPARTDFKKTRLALMALAHFNAFFAGFPFYDLMMPYMNNVAVMRIIFPGTALLGSYMACMSVERPLIEDIFAHYANRYENESVKRARACLSARAKKALTALTKISDAEVSNLSRQVRDIAGEPDFSEDRVLDIVKILLTELPDFLLDPENPQPAAPTTTWTKRVSDITSAAIGASANYILYSLSKSAAQTFLHAFGLENENTEEIVSSIAGILATLPNMFFGAAYAQKDADYIYKAISNKHYIPGFKSSVAHIISVFSAVPQTYIAIEAATSKSEEAIVAATLIGTTMARALAFMMLLDMVIHFGRKNSPQAQRAHLMAMVNKLAHGIAILESSQILALESALGLTATPAPGMTMLDNINVADAASAVSPQINTTARCGFFHKPDDASDSVADNPFTQFQLNSSDSPELVISTPEHSPSARQP